MRSLIAALGRQVNRGLAIGPLACAVILASEPAAV
jgi:hypothetical protein